jgi:hypothetical protein
MENEAIVEQCLYLLRNIGMVAALVPELREQNATEVATTALAKHSGNHSLADAATHLAKLVMPDAAGEVPLLGFDTSGDGMLDSFDTTGDGRVDTLLVAITPTAIPDGKESAGVPLSLSESGHVLGYDTTGDGQVDSLDSTGDGRIDMRLVPGKRTQLRSREYMPNAPQQDAHNSQ